MNVPVLRRQLLKWFNKYQRHSYPWRHTTDPYHVLIAETFLQRTRADQVLPVYTQFIKSFPTVSHLAKAEEQRIKDIMYPLGLAWRSKNLKQTAIDILEKFEGLIPSEREQLLQITGVGEYITDSIRYMAFGKRTSIVDSNVVRIIGRLYDIEVNAESRRDKEFRALADKLLPRKKFKEFNLSLLDLGALVCVRNPSCPVCPINQHCKYYHKTLIFALV